MRFHWFAGSTALAMLIAGSALAQDCTTLKQVATLQMLTSAGSYRELVPVKINGASKLFLLDTGGFITQVSPSTARELNMTPRESALAIYDLSANESHSFVTADTFQLGNLTAHKQQMMVTPAGTLTREDGIISTNLMMNYNVDIDFGSGRMTYFSQDHCPGHVVYWNPKEYEEVPLTIRGSRIVVPVKLDGQDFSALVDTGAMRTTITIPTAQRVFGLEPDGPGMEKSTNINGDPRLASYTHVFQALNLEGINVANLRVQIMPDRLSSGSARSPLSHGFTGQFNRAIPELILGMDVLRHLHIYMAFGEKRFYVSTGSPPRPPTDIMDFLDQALALSPGNTMLLNERCFARGLRNIRLDEALADCDMALKSKPGDAKIIDSRGLILYRLGKYQDALTAYNQALALATRQAPSLFMRGQTKRKLGDGTGGDADVAAAKAMDADAAKPYSGTDIPKD